MLAANAGGHGFESCRGQNLILTFFYLELNVKNCFKNLILNY